MCGPSSAIGLGDAERAQFPWLRERLRLPDHYMGLMRGVLGEDAEVGCVVATNTSGITRALALLVTPEIAGEITMPADAAPVDDIVQGTIAGDPVQVIVRPDAPRTPVAIMISPWIREHLYLYARQLWWPRRK